MVSFPPVSPPKPYTPPLFTHMRHMPSPSHSSRFHHPHNIGWGHYWYTFIELIFTKLTLPQKTYINISYEELREKSTVCLVFNTNVTNSSWRKNWNDRFLKLSLESQHKEKPACHKPSSIFVAAHTKLWCKCQFSAQIAYSVAIYEAKHDLKTQRKAHVARGCWPQGYHHNL